MMLFACLNVLLFITFTEGLTVPQLCAKRYFGYQVQDPENCHSYYVCLGNWGQYNLECGHGYRFNETLQKCIKGKCPPCPCLQNSEENLSEITGYIPAVPVFWLLNTNNDTKQITTGSNEDVVKELYEIINNKSLLMNLSTIFLELNATALKSWSNDTKLQSDRIESNQVVKFALEKNEPSVNFKTVTKLPQQTKKSADFAIGACPESVLAACTTTALPIEITTTTNIATETPLEIIIPTAATDPTTNPTTDLTTEFSTEFTTEFRLETTLPPSPTVVSVQTTTISEDTTDISTELPTTIATEPTEEFTTDGIIGSTTEQPDETTTKAADIDYPTDLSIEVNTETTTLSDLDTTSAELTETTTLSLDEELTTKLESTMGLTVPTTDPELY